MIWQVFPLLHIFSFFFVKFILVTIKLLFSDSSRNMSSTVEVENQNRNVGKIYTKASTEGEGCLSFCLLSSYFSHCPKKLFTEIFLKLQTFFECFFSLWSEDIGCHLYIGELLHVQFGNKMWKNKFRSRIIQQLKIKLILKPISKMISN